MRLWRNLISLNGRDLYRFGVTRQGAYYDAPEQVDAERLFDEVVGKPVPHEIDLGPALDRAQRGGGPLPRRADFWPAMPRTSIIRPPGSA